MKCKLLIVLPVLFFVFAIGNCQNSQIVISGSACVYHNGQVIDHGRTRALTSSERMQLDQYRRDSQRASDAFANSFAPPFPFNGPINPQLNLPELPCFCSSCAGGVSLVDNK